MQENNIRHIATICDDGNIRIIKDQIPPIEPGMVLVKVQASLVSPGTELGGWKTLKTNRESQKPFTTSRKFGYSNSGFIAKVGEGVARFKEGDRVACIGNGYALHSDWAVIPQNLCIHLPNEVSFEQGSYAMLLATAMNSVRRCEPELGERILVVGLGLVGQLTAQLHAISGNFVIAWARYPLQFELAKSWGIDQVEYSDDSNLVEKTRDFTKGYGLDAAILAFAGSSGLVWDQICSSMKKTPDGHIMGRVVMVGSSEINLKWIPANMDIRIAARTGAGYHDEAWECGRDYPEVYMRWTTRTNLELCMELIAQHKINVDCLTTHHVKLLEAEETIGKIIDRGEQIVGLVFIP